MRVAIVYDCLFPWRVGGAERWYRSLAEELVRSGHEVVYLTRREWIDEPTLAFEVIAVSGRGEQIYAESGRRKIAPTLRFGLGVWRYVRKNHDIDVIHAASFPFFSVLGIRAARFGRRRPPLFVDVVEVWPISYWQEYAGRVAGLVGWAIERVAIRLADARFTFTQRQQRQLPRIPMTVLPGLFDGSVAQQVTDATRDPSVVFVGRLIKEKGVRVLPPAIAAARRRLPHLRCEIIGDGPERARLEADVDALGLRDAVSLRGFVADGELQRALSSAVCLLLPSMREGYGLVVVEAAALGTPTITLRHDQNAATTLIDPGVNGWLVDALDPERWAVAILNAVQCASTMKPSALAWGQEMAQSASVERSADVIVNSYEALVRQK